MSGRLLALLVLCLPFFPGSADAQDFPTFSLSGGTIFLSGSNGDGAPLVGIKGGYWWVGKEKRDTLGVEATLAMATDPALYLLRLDLLYPVFARKHWSSSLSAGLGGFSTESRSDPLLAMGVLLSYQPNTPLFTRLDTRYLRVIDVDQGSGWEIGLTLGYQFGYQRKPEPKPPADADGDGVPDRSDRCQDTPKGMEVDQRGCPVNAPDTDADGIPDYRDRCPGTAAGMQIEADGCPPDADQDGVPDVHDRCPSSLPGMPIGPDGCVEVRK